MASAEKDETKCKRVFIVDDHPLVREWLTNLINQQVDLMVCGEGDTAAAALDGIAAHRPDVAVIDISLASTSGLELIKDLKIQHPSVAIIVLSMHDEALYAERALRSGARGYVMKRETSKKIITAIRRVIEGDVFVSEAVSSSMALKYLEGHTAAAQRASPIELLSDRELEVFRLLGQGRGTAEIAESMHVSPKTVQAYCARAKEKLGVRTFTGLLREAVRFETDSYTG
ncbi:MAG: response regulator transcription factor [Verrucomicrobiota bacterium]|nr:response regulator transcription factor [Verrucomicrobiota bacterium]